MRRAGVRVPRPSSKAGIGLLPEVELRKSDFLSEIWYFLGEVEIIFGLWCIPLFLALTYTHGWLTVTNYVNSRDYGEAIYIIVVLAFASTYPIIRLAEKGLGKLAALGGGSPLAWWVVLLSVGTLLGALIKETVAMTILAVLIGRHFFVQGPSSKLAYATLALACVNISAAGMLTSFGSSSTYIVAKAWGWDTSYMFAHFGWKALLGIVLANLTYYGFFKEEFKKMAVVKKHHFELVDLPLETPLWISWVHILFLIWLIYNGQTPLIAAGSFILFLGFYRATVPYQSYMDLRQPLLVGFFIASLIVMSGLQVWWIVPIIESLTAGSALLVSLAISAVTHNASSTLLYAQIPHLSDTLKYVLFTGTAAAGGLTIMANGPNLIAYSILERFFNYNVSFVRFFLFALIPTLIVVLCLMLF